MENYTERLQAGVWTCTQACVQSAHRNVYMHGMDRDVGVDNVRRYVYDITLFTALRATCASRNMFDIKKEQKAL